MKISKKNILLAILIFTAFVPLISYARPKPDLYPNEYYKSVGQVAADRDVNGCEVQAQDYLGGTGTPGRKDAVKETARGAVRGTAMGALAGTITGAGAGRGAGAGAAVGGLGSLMNAKKSQREQESQGSPEFRKYMEACLEDKGYRVVGWR